MLSIFDNGGPPACPVPFNLAAYVLQHAEARAEHPAILISGNTDDQVWSYAAFSAAVRGSATGLLNSGFNTGDILLMRMGNTIDFPIVFLAAISVGIIPVPTSAQLTPREVEHIARDLNPTGVVSAPGISTVSPDRQLSLPDLQKMRDCPAADFVQSDPNQLAYIVYTSGTGGTPRAVGHAHRAIWARRMMIRDWYDLRPQDRLLHAGAFNWTFTLGTGVMDPLSVGATAVIPAADTDLAGLPDILARTEASIFAAVPGVYRKILKSETLPKLPALRHGLAAGEKLSSDIRTQWQTRVGTAIYEAFGMSECSTFISSAPHRPAESKNLGTPQIGRRIAILGEDGPVPIGTEGIIAIHRDDPGLMIGYINAPEETRARYAGDWFLTGDRGIMQESGQITYCGRNDDMMNAGGYRVSPLEVEAIFANHPALMQFAVAEVEVKPGVRIIAGFYKGRDDVTELDLHAFAQERLAEYKRPKTYKRLAEFPTNPNGKLLRRALPDLFKD